MLDISLGGGAADSVLVGGLLGLCSSAIMSRMSGSCGELPCPETAGTLPGDRSSKRVSLLSSDSI